MAQTEDRYGWLGRGLDDDPEENVAPAAAPVSVEAGRVAEDPPAVAAAPARSAHGRQTGVPGLGAGGGRRRRRRRDPNALRNDPGRTQIGAYVRRDVKREVDRALADGRIFPEGNGSLSVLVDGLLERWLAEVGYGGDGEGERAGSAR